MSTWVYGAGYILLALGMIAIAPRNVPPGVAAGTVPFAALKTVHAMTAVFFAIHLAAHAMDDKSSGTLGFLKIANLSPRSWVAFRFLALLAGYAPVWIMRLPVYALVLSLGGILIEDVLWLEAIQGMAFLCLGCLALLVSRSSTTALNLGFATMLTAALWQVALYLPLIVIGVLKMIENRPLAAADYPWAGAISQLGLPRYFVVRPADSQQWTVAGLSILLHLILCGVLLSLLTRVLYVGAGTEMAETPMLTGAARRSNSRPSRRVWDDALAWQVCHVHCNHGSRARIGAAIFGAACVVALCFGVAKETVVRTLLVGVTSGVTLAVLAFKPSDCLSREVRGKTLSTLALLPLDGREIYQAWARGSRRMALPVYYVIAVGVVIMLLIAPERAPYWAMVLAATVLLLPEAAFLSNVLTRKVSFLKIDFVQVFVNLWSAFLIGMVLVISLPVAIGVNPWLGLVTMIGLSLFVRWLLIVDCASYLAVRVEREQ